MANILVTGANGQLGTELRNRSFSLLDDVFYTDVEELDITSAKAVSSFIETHEIDTIINCAAYTAVDQAEDDEERAAKINVMPWPTWQMQHCNMIVYCFIFRRITCLTARQTNLTPRRVPRIRKPCTVGQNWKGKKL